MSSALFNVKDWYWIVGGDGPHKKHAEAAFTGDESRVYSSVKLAYVPSDDSEYGAWRSQMGSRLGMSDPTTRIDTEENLADVLSRHGIQAVFEKPK